MKYCWLTDGNSLYLNDWSFDDGTNTSHVTQYWIEGNKFENGTSIDISSGAGFSGPVSGRKIINNYLDGDYFGSTAYWPLISFNGSGTGVPWFVQSVGGAIITGNTFINSEQYIRHRGVVDNSQFDWGTYWTDNTFDRSVITLSNDASFTPRSFSYPGGYGLYTNVIRIGSVINADINNVAQSGDFVRVGAGAYDETLTINKSISLLGPNTGINPNVNGDATSINPARLAEAVLKSAASSGAMIVAGANNINVQVRGLTLDRSHGTANDARFMDLINRTGNVWTFENNILKNAPSTVNGYFYLTGTTTGMDFTFNQNRFSNNGLSNGIAFWGSDPTLVTVTNNVWYNNQGWAINSNSIHGTISGNSFVEDRIAAADIPNYSNYQNGVLFANVNNNINLTANLFRKVHIGMYLYRWSAFNGIVNVTENIFDQAFQNGVRVLPGSSNPDLTDVRVNYNSFLAGSIIEATGQAMTLNATCNWYESNNPAVINTKIYGPVTYEPWLNSGTDTNPAQVGFQPGGACTGSSTDYDGDGVPNGLDCDPLNPLIGAPPTVSCPANKQVCSNAPAFSLSGGTPLGGTYTGTGVSATGIFSPAVAGVGTHTINYSYTDGNGCSNSCNFTITVKQAPVCSITSIPANNTYTGGIPTNLYIGYGPQSTKLKVSAGPSMISSFTYSWTGTNTALLSSTTSSEPVFTPTSAGNYTYTVVVTANGCTTTCSITLCVRDVRELKSNGKPTGKIYVCHLPTGNPGNPQTILVSVNSVPTHIGAHGGDRLGKCSDAPCPSSGGAPFTGTMVKDNYPVITDEGFRVLVSPNPSRDEFVMRVNSQSAEPVTIRIIDVSGKVVRVLPNIPANTAKVFGADLVQGMYVAEVLQGNNRQTVKLLKME